MHDLRLIRDNPDLFDRALARRGLTPNAGAILKIDEERRHQQATLQELQQRRNAASKEIGIKKSRGEDAAGLMDEVARIKLGMDVAQQLEGQLAEKLNALLAQLPNLPADDVPDGQDETANQEIRRWGEPKHIDNPKPHDELGEALGQMDFAQAAKMSGARFVVLRDGLARLERALANFMLDLHTGEYGYQEVNPPHLVRDDAVFGTGQLPKFAEDLFKTTDGYWLIPTAEVSLTNLVADSILDAQILPLRFTAFTPCYRSEAGAAGKDTRGMIRQHQFSKVELVSIVRPEESDTELERMAGCAEEVLKRLELPYRVMKLCAGDMGFSARRTYDLEVWLPAQNQYREISSCSSCGDFQARRMGARFKEAGQKGTNFVHTLNGSGLAVGRTLVAILENYQQPDGSVAIPTVLRPYMKGQEVLRPS